MIFCVYGRFLSIKTASKTPIMMTTTTIRIDIGRMYWSANDTGVGVGAFVACGAFITVNADVADDGQ